MKGQKQFGGKKRLFKQKQLRISSYPDFELFVVRYHSLLSIVFLNINMYLFINLMVTRGNPLQIASKHFKLREKVR